MARGKEFPLFVILKAIDKATAPLRGLAKTAANTAKPFQRLRDLNNRARLAAEAGGIGKITGACAKLGSTVGSVVKKMLTLGAAIGSVVMLGGGFLYKITRQTSEYGDMVWKTSQKIGIAVEAWQEIAHAGEMSGIEQEALSAGLVKLNKNIVEAANGNKTLTTWFKRAGISVKDESGKIKSADQILMELANTFGKVPDGAKKTAIAVALAGRSGANLIPMLNSGSKGLAEMRKEARDLGLVLDEDTARASETFNDNIDRMMKSIRGIVFYIGGLLIPVFDDIVVSVRKWVIANRELIQSKLKEWVENLKKALPELKKNFFKAIDVIKNFFIKISQGLKIIGGFEGLLKGIAVYIGVSFVASIAMAANAFIALGTTIMTTPVGWILAAIAAIVIGAILIYRNWDKVSAALKAFGHAIFTPLRLFGELIDYLTSFNLFDIGAKIFTSLWDGMKSIFERLKKWLGEVKESIKSIFPGFNKPELPGPAGSSPASPASARIQKAQQGAYVQHKNTAAVQIDFANMPKGTKVKTEKNDGVDMDLNMGYSMLS